MHQSEFLLIAQWSRRGTHHCEPSSVQMGEIWAVGDGPTEKSIVELLATVRRRIRAHLRKVDGSSSCASAARCQSTASRMSSSRRRRRVRYEIRARTAFEMLENFPIRTSSSKRGHSSSSSATAGLGGKLRPLDRNGGAVVDPELSYASSTPLALQFLGEPLGHERVGRDARRGAPGGRARRGRRGPRARTCAAGSGTARVPLLRSPARRCP